MRGSGGISGPAAWMGCELMMASWGDGLKEDAGEDCGRAMHGRIPT